MVKTMVKTMVSGEDGEDFPVKTIWGLAKNRWHPVWIERWQSRMGICMEKFRGPKPSVL